MKKSLVGILSILLLAGIPFLGFAGGQTQAVTKAPVTVIFPGFSFA